MIQVKKVVAEVLINEGIKLEIEAVKKLSMIRENSINEMFVNVKSFFIIFNLNTFILQSSNEFYPKSRLEVYYDAIQAALRTSKCEQSSFPKKMLNNFLIDLNNYFHLHSDTLLLFDSINDLQRLP